jgi:UDP:flavonoid glycosyltransferase YjiC (YdhE family)
MQIVFYVSGHGFGHATRDAALMAAIAARRHDSRFVVRTTAPARVFDALDQAAVEVQPVDTDTGVAQIDSLHPDEIETARRAAAFYAEFDRRASHEAAVLRALSPRLVIGDIPPLAFEAAALAGVPSVALGNFTWDWIYAGYPAVAAIAPDAIGVVRRAYAKATHTLRLPLHGGFDAMGKDVEDIPFIARQSARGRADARRALDVADERLIVLASFGGYDVNLPYGAIASTEEFALLTPERGFAAGLRHEDLVAAADVVVSKPGYGIVSECLANDTPLLYTSRGRFAEYDVFVAQMPRILRCRFLPQDDLLAGRWAPAVRALLGQPMPASRVRVDGADVAARRILQWMGELELSSHEERVW